MNIPTSADAPVAGDALHPACDPTCTTRLSADATRALHDSYFHCNGMVSQHIDGFNRFLRQDLLEIVRNSAVRSVVHPDGLRRTSFIVRNPYIRRPCVTEPGKPPRAVYPAEVLKMCGTYEMTLYVDIVATEYARDRPEDSAPWRRLHTVVGRPISLGPVPCMIGSDACNLSVMPDSHESARMDFGGDFIINGIRRVVIPQEKPIHSQCRLLYKGSSKEWCVEMRARPQRRQRSTSTLTIYMPLAVSSRSTRLYAVMPYVTDGPKNAGKLCKLPITALSRAMGFVSEDHLVAAVVSNGRSVAWPLAGRAGSKSALSPTALWLRMVLQEDETWFKCGSFWDGTDEDAMEWIMSQSSTARTTREERVEQFRTLMHSEIHPQHGSTGEEHVQLEKRRLWAHMLWMLTRTAQMPEAERRRFAHSPDDMGLKQYEHAGFLTSLRIRQAITDIMTLVLKKFLSFNFVIPADFHRLVRTKSASAPPLQEPLRYAFLTGNFQLDRSTKVVLTASQMLTDQSLQGKLGHMNRVSVPLKVHAVSVVPRLVPDDGSQFGGVCASATSEGKNVGFIKEMACMATLCPGYDVVDMLAVPFATQPELEPGRHSVLLGSPDATADSEDAEIRALRDAGGLSGWVMANGVCAAFVDDMWAAADAFRRCKRGGTIPKHTSVWVNPDMQCLVVEGMPGTVRIPLIYLGDDHDAKSTFERIQDVVREHGGASHAVWKELESDGIVEWAGANDIKNYHVRLAPDLVHTETSDTVAWQPFTHCMVSRTAHQSCTLCHTVLSNHNQSPRNTYSGAMARAAMAQTYTTENPHVTQYVLEDTARPTMTSRLEDVSGTSDAPAGINAIVAVIPMGGINEDAIVLNSSSAALGFGRASLRSYTSHHLPRAASKTEHTRFGRPGPDTRDAIAKSFDHILEDGTPKPGTVLRNGDVTIGCVLELPKNGGTVDRSIYARVPKGDKVRVSSVRKFEDASRTSVVVGTYQSMLPEVGSKMSSRHGQKGIIGAMIPREDMPFTRSGIVPDIILNPHGFHSRMTIAQILEMMMTKVAATLGVRVDGTPFVDLRVLGEQLGLTVEEVQAASDDPFAVHAAVSAALAKLGFNSDGEETLTCGTSGERLQGAVFMGPCWYQMLKQVASSKFHARSVGPVVPLTRQPTQGKARDGGLRMGEMEKDAFVAWGAEATLLDRTSESCDRTIVVMCRKCGLLAEPACDTKLARKSFITRASEPYCRACKTGNYCENVITRHAWRLTQQELMGMSVALRAILDDGDDDSAAARPIVRPDRTRKRPRDADVQDEADDVTPAVSFSRMRDAGCANRDESMGGTRAADSHEATEGNPPARKRVRFVCSAKNA